MKEIICKRCIMNNTTRFISLDKDGICNYCHSHDELNKQFPINGNEKKIAKKIISEGKNKKFDCILGLSGGRDSTYLVVGEIIRFKTFINSF